MRFVAIPILLLLNFTIGFSYLRKLAGEKVKKPKLAGMRQTRLDLNLFETSNASNTTNLPSEEAFTKCYDTLGVVAINGTVNTTQYLTFLDYMTDGTFPFSSFSDLPAVFVLIFNTAACGGGRDCVSQEPSVSLERSSEAAKWLYFFCSQLLTFIFTESSLRFDYQVRYNTTLLSQEQLSICLQQAAERLLIEQIAGCDLSPASRRIKFASDMKYNRSSLNVKDFMQYLHIIEPNSTDSAHLEFRSAKEDDVMFSSASLASPCQFNVSAVVDNLVDFDCQEVANNISCIVVQSTATIVAQQIVEPHSDSLEQQMRLVLREAINGGQFENYLPENCILNA